MVVWLTPATEMHRDSQSLQVADLQSLSQLRGFVMGLRVTSSFFLSSAVGCLPTSRGALDPYFTEPPNGIRMASFGEGNWI